eukprot:SAG31_NODE_3003_length_4795_cov_4.386499_6_plen_353_part_00
MPETARKKAERQGLGPPSNKQAEGATRAASCRQTGRATSRGAHPAAARSSMLPPAQRRRLQNIVGATQGGAAVQREQQNGRTMVGSCAAGRVSLEHMENYCRDGFVLVRGLIAPHLVEAAVESVWRQMAGVPKSIEVDPWAKPERPRPQRNDPSTHPDGGWAGIVSGPEITAVFSQELIAAAAELARGYEAHSPFPSCDHQIAAPQQTLAINQFPPADRNIEWQWPGPHTDGGSGLRTTPRACRIQHMTYLTGPRPGQPGGGGTVAWPGSSRALEQVYMRDQQKYEWMADLGTHVASICETIQPVEVMPAAGDVLFFDIFTAHSGSTNLAPEPRLALNHKYGIQKGNVLNIT